MYKADMIADSISPKGHRISTMKVTMPRIILAEFNTHRMFSRNSASSRAIPFERMINAVQDTPFIPLRWMTHHTGMQGTDYIEDPEQAAMRTKQWLHARDRACSSAWELYKEYTSVDFQEPIPGVTKQMVNRMLETWMWQTVLVTATEYENFFALRVDPAAEIHMQHVAELMLSCMNSTKPKFLNEGYWHMPFGDQMTEEDLLDAFNGTPYFDQYYMDPIGTRIKIAVARCAQVSYTVVGEEGKPLDFVKLVQLHDRLLKAGHMSPFEHVARCMTEQEYEAYGYHKPDVENPNFTISTGECGWCGNFRGWIQYRKTLPNENRSDNRLKKLA